MLRDVSLTEPAVRAQAQTSDIALLDVDELEGSEQLVAFVVEFAGDAVFSGDGPDGLSLVFVGVHVRQAKRCGQQGCGLMLGGLFRA